MQEPNGCAVEQTHCLSKMHPDTSKQYWKSLRWEGYPVHQPKCNVKVITHNISCKNGRESFSLGTRLYQCRRKISHTYWFGRQESIEESIEIVWILFHICKTCTSMSRCRNIPGPKIKSAFYFFLQIESKGQDQISTIRFHMTLTVLISLLLCEKWTCLYFCMSFTSFVLIFFQFTINRVVNFYGNASIVYKGHPNENIAQRKQKIYHQKKKQGKESLMPGAISGVWARGRDFHQKSFLHKQQKETKLCNNLYNVVHIMLFPSCSIAWYRLFIHFKAGYYTS